MLSLKEYHKLGIQLPREKRVDTNPQLTQRVSRFQSLDCENKFVMETKATVMKILAVGMNICRIQIIDACKLGGLRQLCQHGFCKMVI